MQYAYRNLYIIYQSISGDQKDFGGSYWESKIEMLLTGYDINAVLQYLNG